MSLHHVVLFGATSAIAQEIARILAARGAELFLVGRDPARLEAVAADLRVRGAGRVESVALDLNDVDRFPALLDRIHGALGRVDLAVVAQGVLGNQQAAEANVPDGERILYANLVGPAVLLQQAANRMVPQGAGTLAAISSVAGDRGRQSNYFYGAAKGGLSVFLSGLRNRMTPHGVHVLTVKPGFVDTPMTAQVPKNPLFASPERVAAAIVRAAERRRNVVYVPGFWRAIMLVIRAVPETLFKRLKL